MHPVALVLAVALAGWTGLRWRQSSNERRVLGVIGALALVAYGSGLVPTPNVEKIVEHVGRRLGQWTYVLVGALAFLETGAFIGLIAPGETAIILGGVIAGQGEINVIFLLGLVWACALGGDLVSFAFGRRLGREFMLRHGPRFKITEERLVQVEQFYGRHGGKTVLIGRFISLVRAVSPFIAGASRMPFSRFLPYDVIGAGLWGSLYVLLGYVFWHSFDKVTQYAGRGAFVFGTVVLIVVGIVWLVRTLKDRERREAARARLDELEARRWIGPVVGALRRLRRRLVPVWERVSGPLLFLWNRVTPGELGLELTTLLAVVAVGSFAFVGYALLLHGGTTPTFDGNALDLADRLRTGWTTDVAKGLSVLGSLPYVSFVVLATAGFLAARRRITEAGALVIAMALTVAAVHVAKASIDRARPSGSLVDTVGSSFPSGHAAYAMAFVACAVALRHALPGFASRSVLVVVSVAGAALIGASRVLLRAHYMSDVIGGWGLGATMFALLGMAALVIAFLRHNGRRT